MMATEPPGRAAPAADAEPAPPMRLLVVDDHSLFREGLVSFLATRPEVTVVGQAGTVSKAIALARATQPDVVLMDFVLIDGTGVEATRAILAERPATKIVFLTAHEDDERLFNAVRAGAVGYLAKSVKPAELLKTLQAVARGEAGLSGVMTRRVLQEFTQNPAPNYIHPHETTHLTTREIEIICELARGAKNHEIAEKFTLSEWTVKKHITNILAKLQLRNRHEVVVYAREHYLLS